MIDALTGSKVSVESTDADGPYVIVPPRQVNALSRLLTERRIPHAVEAEVPSHHHAESPAELVVRLSLAVEVINVQDILDQAP